eukprot:5200717-Amphidinium_carterae.1
MQTRAITKRKAFAEEPKLQTMARWVQKRSLCLLALEATDPDQAVIIRLSKYLVTFSLKAPLQGSNHDPRTHGPPLTGWCGSSEQALGLHWTGQNLHPQVSDAQVAALGSHTRSETQCTTVGQARYSTN